ncbi:TPA: hypothetical protein RNS96_000240 [Stenotrophomonas maltophilia]|uniref:Uncharacterized protein n=1 Tax=Stenotrophomonas maltophilia TaxID=40324 RepID=A0AAI9C705_STEMA|nr:MULTISPECIES: hypothetical protein [Stenotrophomonas]EKT4439475.1 hypothetical protein [Stenotrophomonas maltophilia]MBB1135761.1 hypothetical protein [Stenotrophomonas sp. I18B00994]MBH1561246.1 hypothetical protein [Stenotrophomonas maltophilia]HDX0879884.1 hypothetical protein [Stenotrophomonas maltophilia]
MDTNKDIEEAFCAAFSHIIVDGDELLEKAQWVARGFCHLSNHAPDGNVTWDALILQRYDCKIGHGKTTPELDVQLLECVFKTARQGYALNLLRRVNNHSVPRGLQQ